MVDVVITLPSTDETFQYRFGKAIPTISQPRNPKKKAKASTIAFIFPFFLLSNPSRVIQREKHFIQALTLQAIFLHKRVDLFAPKSQCAGQVPTNPWPKILKKTTNKWLIPNSPLMMSPIILNSIEPFQRLQMFTQQRGQQRGEVKPSNLLTNVYRLKAICHLLTFSLNTVSIRSKRYWWFSSHVLAPHFTLYSRHDGKVCGIEGWGCITTYWPLRLPGLLPFRWTCLLVWQLSPKDLTTLVKQM